MYYYTACLILYVVPELLATRAHALMYNGVAIVYSTYDHEWSNSRVQDKC